MYAIEFKKSVKKDLKNIDRHKLRRIFDDIETLKNGIGGNENIIKLKGSNPYYRLRSGDYRVIFEKQDDKLIILIIKVGHRKDIYNKTDT